MQIKFSNPWEQIEVDCDLGLLELEVADYEVDYDGIGLFEHHGYRGYDAGNAYAIPVRIKVLSVNQCTDSATLFKTQSMFNDLWKAGQIDITIEEYPSTDREGA